MLFVDLVKISIKAGDGGDGSASFRREKYVPRGGPDGGDGGKGGDVVLKASGDLSTLLDLKYRPLLRVKRAGHGSGKGKSGKDSPDLVIRVPLGSVARDALSGELLAELTVEGQAAVVAKGGKGGKGNVRFATPTHQSPTEAEPGRKGEGRWLLIELKLLADLGLVGSPNAGKSTLLSRISSARPKIADYPFTTLSPHLGAVRWEAYKSFIVADIPGLIEGAHTGKGLGTQFLRHIERTRLLAILVDISETSDEDPVAEFAQLRREMGAYHPMLLEKPFTVVATKADVKGSGSRLERLADFCRREGVPFYAISALTGEGLKPLVRDLGRRVEEVRKSALAQKRSALTC